MKWLEEVQEGVKDAWVRIGELPPSGQAAAGLGALVGCGIVCAATVESLLRAREHAKFSPRGRLVETSTGVIHAVMLEHTQASKDDSDEAQRPTIIVDAGVGCWSLVYEPLMHQLADVARVIAFDRSGFGHSSFVEGGNRVLDHATYVPEMLNELGVKGPIVYVAHSMAGAFATNFAVHNKGRIAGVVYMDALNYRSAKNLSKIMKNVKDQERPSLVSKAMSRLGVLRLLTYMRKLPSIAAYSREMIPELVATTTKWQWLESVKLDLASVFELYGLLDDDGRPGFSVEKEGCLDDIPVTLLLPDYYLTQSASKQVPREKFIEAHELAKSVLRFSSDAKLHSLEDCSHWVMWDCSYALVEEVQDVIRRHEKRTKKS